MVFQAGVLFCIENAKFCPILACFGQFLANLRTFWRTFSGLDSVVVYQNPQISDILRASWGCKGDHMVPSGRYPSYSECLNLLDFKSTLRVESFGDFVIVFVFVFVLY